jgi:NAD(P)-dependent dehydrogenase (short-subunit alcohol dehydrogenase family)
MTTPKLRLQSKVALVTGGTKGIGRATVLTFLDEGAAVIFTGSSAEQGPVQETELREQGRDVRFVQCDSRDEQQVIDLINRIVAWHGRLDIAVNNVGSTAPTDSATAMIHEASLQGFQDTLDMALRSTFLSMKHELGQMVGQSGGGVICNTASIAGIRVSTVGSPGYHAAKAAVVHLTRKAAIQYAQRGIRVNVVAPGATATEQVLRRFSREEFDKLATLHPMGKAVTPEEVAQAFLYLCSDASASITGLVLPIDGGWSAG